VERWQIDFFMNTGTNVEDASLLMMGFFTLILEGLHVKQFILIIY
jgi:hypothetical protein